MGIFLTIFVGYIILAGVCSVWLYVNKDNKKLSTFFFVIQDHFNQIAQEKNVEEVDCKTRTSLFVMSMLLWWYIPVMINRVDKSVKGHYDAD